MDNMIELLSLHLYALEFIVVYFYALTEIRCYYHSYVSIYYLRYKNASLATT